MVSFKTSLPDHCSAFHLKLFPHSHSLFSDDDESPPATSRSSSPAVSQFPIEYQAEVAQPPKKRAKTTGVARQASPAMTTISSAQDRSLSRARSRSLSIALVQERAESMGAISKKRVLNREVSMSRVFKPKPRPKEGLKRESSTLKLPVVKKEKDEGTLLVEATPVKPKPRPAIFQRPKPLPAQFMSQGMEEGEEDEDEEEIWNLPSSSPDILLLRGESPEDDGFDLTPPTPTKKRGH